MIIEVTQFDQAHGLTRAVFLLHPDRQRLPVSPLCPFKLSGLSVYSSDFMPASSDRDCFAQRKGAGSDSRLVKTRRVAGWARSRDGQSLKIASSVSSPSPFCINLPPARGKVRMGVETLDVPRLPPLSPPSPSKGEGNTFSTLSITMIVG